MGYPIDDIFEGVADLLLEHGEFMNNCFTEELHMADTYISYRHRVYKLRYVGGELCEIFRLPSYPMKGDDDNGKN